MNKVLRSLRNKITKKMQRSAKGAAAGAAAGTAIGALEIHKGTKKADLAHIIKRAKQGSLGGAGAGALYHDLRVKAGKEDSLNDDGANLTEMAFLRDKLDAAKVSSKKLSQDLDMLAGWYERLATLTSKASKFVDKHPYVASALHWGAKKFSSK